MMLLYRSHLSLSIRERLQIFLSYLGESNKGAGLSVPRPFSPETTRAAARMGGGTGNALKSDPQWAFLLPWRTRPAACMRLGSTRAKTTALPTQITSRSVRAPVMKPGNQ